MTILEQYGALFDKKISSTSSQQINSELKSITDSINIETIPIEDRVALSNYILCKLSYDQRKQLAVDLIKEQIINQQNLLSHWSIITAQSSIIDTGYIAQHLVSLQTQIAGQGMRGKGDDLCDGSEVKAANFLGSLDKKGAKEPRWNFNAVSIEIMERFLSYKAIYLLSIDHNTTKNIRIRIWKVNIQKHTILRNRYKDWMNRLGYPKFNDPHHKSVNFQLFPPNNQTDETFARHGNDQANGFPKLKIPLENYEGSELILKAEIENNQPNIKVF